MKLTHLLLISKFLYLIISLQLYMVFFNELVSKPLTVPAMKAITGIVVWHPNLNSFQCWVKVKKAENDLHQVAFHLPSCPFNSRLYQLNKVILVVGGHANVGAKICLLSVVILV